MMFNYGHNCDLFNMVVPYCHVFLGSLTEYMSVLELN